MNGRVIMQWIKANLVIVICAVVILGSLTVAPIIAGGMNEELADEAKSRLRKLDDLERSSKSAFAWPGASESTQLLLTEPIVEAYKMAAAERTDQSEGVITIVQSSNRGGADVVMPQLFPTPQNLERDLQVLPPELHKRIMAGYDRILATVHAGTAPTNEELSAELNTKRTDFIDRQFRKTVGERLSKEEEESLKDFLIGQRRAICRDRANEIGLYLSKETLSPPDYSNTQKPTLDEMFAWQWRLWVLDRVAKSIESINGSNSEPMAPIHSLNRLDVRGLLSTQTPAAGDRSFGDGSRSGSGESGNGVPGAGTRDYSKSITGRVTNDAFDVVLVDLDMIVATDRIDEVLAGFTVPVVMSVLDVEVAQADAFAALKVGEYLGEGAVSRLVVTVETLWLRDWSGELMPNEARTKIGMAARPSAEGAPEESY
ncbi:MAG: hypothetical protein P8I91_00505 [Phycisphaerales bacterium]|nr:hypothetical protein [Phycisphaerales bacterium]